MTVSTRGRYALRVVIDLAENGGDDLIPLRKLAERQGISHKYLEHIIPLLSKAGFVEGVAGKGGGYRLTQPPSEMTVLDVVALTEGELAPVVCTAEGSDACRRTAECRAMSVWQGLSDVITGYLGGITIADLMR